ncbi:MAG TPA: hypothetical protein PK543_01795 [Candidatus Saccharibacteria bacterium]|nr:hypothetical protein [Candidatus Saccharibacteria bacterium]
MLDFVHKHKILLFISLALLSGLLTTLFTGTSVSAAGESYTQGSNTSEIRAKGGIWDKILKTAKENADSKDSLALEMNKSAGITDINLKGGYVSLILKDSYQFVTRSYILLDSAATGSCALAVIVNKDNPGTGKVTAIPSGKNAELQGYNEQACKDQLDFFTAYDDITIATGSSISDSPVSIYQGDDVFNSLLGVLVFPCDPASDPDTMKGAVLELCKKNRAAAIDNLTCDPTATNKAGRCSPEVVDIVSCLYKNPTYSVAKCGNRAQAWADGNTSNVNGNLKDEDIEKICDDSNLSVEDKAKCKENAQTARDSALLTGCDADPTGPDCEAEKTSCAIDGIGWLVCPVLTFLGTLADGMYNAIAGMLTVDNDLVSVNGKTSDTVSTTYSAWGTMRNIANVAFVIVFLIIIFSQLTNMVVSNYGVKKLLPRLIIAAILVNLSYTVCQLAVDISNILGWSLRDVFTALAPAADVTKTTGDASGNFGGWAAIVAIIIGGAGIAFAALSALIPILLAALIGLVVVFLILLLRKALIVILIIISPLAFVAFLLPNTEQWFKKWFKAFGSMLMVFPIVAVVFGASALAADIIKAAGDNNASGDANPWMQLIAMGVAAAPLMIVPGILKKSIDGVGNVGAAINKFGAKAGSGLGKLGAKGFENTALSRGRASRKQGRQIYRDQKFARAMTRGGIRAKAARGPSITGAQKFANQALTRSAYAASDKADQEAETAAEMMITKRAMLTDSERQTVAKGGSVTKNGVQIDGSDRAYRRAAIKIQASGKHDHIKELVDRGMTGEDAQLLAASIGASPNKPIWAGQGALQEIAQGTGKKTSELIESAVKADAYSSEKIATGDKDELAEVYATVTSSSSTLSSGERVKLRDNATAVDSNPELKAKVAKNRAEVSSLQTI